MPDETAVLSQSSLRVVAGIGVEQPVDHHRQQRNLRIADGARQSDIDRSVLQRRQATFQHGLGQSADQVAASGRDLCFPLHVVESAGPVSLIERIESRGNPVAQLDRHPADSSCDGRVFALRVARHIDPLAERKRPGVKALGQRRLARADDPGNHDVRGGDEPVSVKDPRVVDERSTAVEVLPDEHPVRPETALRDERIRPAPGRRGVLRTGQPQSPRCLQARRPRLPGLGQDDHRPAFRRELLGFLLGCGLAGLAIGCQQGLCRRFASASVAASLPS